jgi:RHS repeat-associated protein
MTVSDVCATSVCFCQSRFTGKERDAESGNDYFGARYYASSMGRFLSPDPLYIEMHRLADPQQLNLYMYGRNNPLSITDPTGLDITCGGTRCADYLSGLQKDIKGFNVDYDKNGKVETVGDVNKKGLSKSDKAFLSAIDDTKHHVTINATGGAGDASTFFGASHGSTHTINFDQAALLDGAGNAGGMTSASLVGHETLEGYDESKGNSMEEGHNWAASLGFPGMTPLSGGGTYSLQNGMVIGLTGNWQIQGTNTIETIGTRFVTPIPQADFLKNARSDHPTPSPAYPVSVEKKQ